MEYEVLAQQLNGHPITCQEIAEATGKSLPYIRNRKKLLATTYGFNIVSNKGRKTQASSEELTPELIKKAINTIYYESKLPVPFIDVGVLRDSSVSQALNFLYRDKVQLRSIVSTNSQLYTALLEVNSILNKAERVEGGVRVQRRVLSTTFTSVTNGLKATTEQLSTIAACLDFILNSSGTGACIQSKAGTSKSTCLSVVRQVIEDLGFEVPKTVAKTNLAIKGTVNGSTVARYFNDKIGINVVGWEYEDVGYALRSALDLDPSLIDEVLIVEEYSMLSREELALLEMCARRILYVGDILQLASVSKYPARILKTMTEQFRFLSSKTDIQKRLTTCAYTGNLKMAESIVDDNCCGVVIGEVIYEKDNKSSNLVARAVYDGMFDHLTEMIHYYTTDDNQILAYSANACKELNRVANGGTLELKVGSKVMNQERIVKQGIEPSTQMRIIGEDPELSLYICKDLSTLYTYNIPKSAKLELAFAMTTAKSEGSQWEEVLCLMNTAPKEKKLSDYYVQSTRAKVDLKIIKRISVDLSSTKVGAALTSTVGCRNSQLFGALCVLMKNNKGLPPQEIKDMLRSLYKTVAEEGEELVVDVELEDLLSPEGSEEALPDTPLELSNNYAAVFCSGNRTVIKGGPVLGAVHTKEVASSMVSGGKGFIAKNLHKGNEVVLDCDSPEMVAQFEDLISQTESWVSPDRSKAHIVFKTDKWVPSRRKHEGAVQLDLLGNTRSQMRYLKPNKHHNGLSPMVLTDEVLSRIHSSIDE